MIKVNEIYVQGGTVAGLNNCQRQKALAHSDAQNLQRLVVADGDPVGVRSAPLYLVDLAGRGVGEDRVLDGARHRLDVPDERLIVVGRRANVTARVRCPGQSVDEGAVVVQLRHWSEQHAQVQNGNL